ncbi:MAG: MFS transporter [Acidobacteriota bacterium]
MGGFLKRLGLETPAQRAWAMYDWGNSAFITVIVTAIFPIYYQTVVAADLEPAQATARFSYVTSGALVLVALLSPLLGALADARAWRKRFLTVWLLIGVLATAAMAWVGEGDGPLGLTLFAIGNVAVLLSIVFNDSLLPHIAREEQVDRLSAAGYALGYLGGGLLLAVNLVLYLQPETFGLADAGVAIRVGFVLTAIWWFVFSLPVLRKVPEPPAEDASASAGLGDALRRLASTLSQLRRYRQAFLLLVAVLVYNDGVSTIYRLATIYGTEIGLPQSSLITAILLVQFVGVPFAFLFGSLAARIGTKRAILIGLSVYLVISVFGYFVTTSTHFFIMAILVAMVQGGVQSLSRSLFASMIPPEKSSEFFGFFGVAERFAAVLGPLVFGYVTAMTGSSRYAVVSVVVFFLVGGALLLKVDVDEGVRVARS